MHGVHSGSDAPIELDIKEEGNKVVFYIRDHGKCIAPERLVNCLTAVQVH